MKLPYFLVIALASGVASFSVLDVVYFEQLGYSIAFVGLMVSVFNIAVTLAELPFAIIFDRYSSKLALYIGFLIRIAAFCLFAANFGASSVLLAQALAGIATAAASGTTVSLVLNEVKERTYESMSVEKGRLTLLSSLGSLLGGTLGAVAFYFSPPLIWILAAVFFALGIIIVAFFKDKPAEAAGEDLKTLFQSWLGVFKFSSTYLLAAANASAIGPVLLWQVKFDGVGTWFVVLGFYIVTLSATVGARLFSFLKLDQRHIGYVALVNVAAAIAFAFSSGEVAVPITFSLHVISHVVLAIQLEGLFHARVENKIRASASSIISLADSAAVAVFAPVIGLVADRYDLSSAIAVSAFLYLFIAGLSYLTTRTVEDGGSFGSL